MHSQYRKEMHVAFSINDGYVSQFLIALTSLLECNKNLLIHVHILQKDLTPVSKMQIEHFEYRYPTCRINYIDMAGDVCNTWAVNINYLSPEAWFRLRLPEKLPEVKWLLYLDADLVVIQNLGELADIDMSGYLLAGAEDLQIKRGGHNSTIGLDDNDLYVNSGVLCMNLEELRNTGIDAELIRFAQENAEKLPMLDQDTLNIVCRGRIRRLPSCMNFTTADARRKKHLRAQARIAHFTGARKPWLPKCRNYFRKYWHRAAAVCKRHLRKVRVGIVAIDSDEARRVQNALASSQHLEAEVLMSADCFGLTRVKWAAKFTLWRKHLDLVLYHSRRSEDSCVLLAKQLGVLCIPYDEELTHADSVEGSIKQLLRRFS